MTFHYTPEVLEALAGHGLRPRPETTPARLREAVNDLYRYEIRRLRDRCRAGEFPSTALAGHVRRLRRRYLLLSTPVARWTTEQGLGDGDPEPETSRPR